MTCNKATSIHSSQKHKTQNTKYAVLIPKLPDWMRNERYLRVME